MANLWVFLLLPSKTFIACIRILTILHFFEIFWEILPIKYECPFLVR